MANQYTDSAPFVVPRPIVNKNGVNIETITADKDLVLKDAHIQIITNDKGSSATIKTPAKRNGLSYWFKNDAASGHAFVVQDIDGNPIVGGGGVAAGKTCYIACDGSNWAVVFLQA